MASKRRVSCHHPQRCRLRQSMECSTLPLHPQCDRILATSAPSCRWAARCIATRCAAHMHVLWPSSMIQAARRALAGDSLSLAVIPMWRSCVEALSKNIASLPSTLTPFEASNSDSGGLQAQAGDTLGSLPDAATGPGQQLPADQAPGSGPMQAHAATAAPVPMCVPCCPLGVQCSYALNVFLASDVEQFPPAVP